MEKYLVSARKYRPATFASVVGQKALTATLKNAVATNRLAHSYLFCGSRGVGKTSCARIFAKTINCECRTPDGEACNECESCRAFNAGTSMNIVELDAASNNGVDDIRKLVEQVQVPPSIGRYRVFIVDEVHMLSSAAFNAFLKTLEEPPSYVVFILATTEKHKIIPTILSRCQIYDFHRITIQDMIDHMAYVAQQEGIQAETSALNVIASKADGAMRDALSIFDQVAASSGGNITYQSTIDNLNVLDYDYYHRLLDTFLAGDVLASWVIYKQIRDNGFDSQFFINGLAAYLRDLMVARDAATISLVEAGDEVRSQLAQRATKCSPEFLYKAMSLCNDADLNYRVASNKQFLVELTLAKICQPLSPSPNNDGNGEGQLRPIAANGRVANDTVAPRQTPTTQSPTPAPSATPKPTSPKPVAATVHTITPTPRPTPTVGTIAPRISIRRAVSADANTTTATEQNAQQRTKPFSDDDLMDAWNNYIQAHPTEHILINTMRAAPPVLVTRTHFTMQVQNQMQLDLIEANRADILRKLHDALSNDLITFEISVNNTSSPRHTLNDRELLAQLREEYPSLNSLIDTFKLRLS